MKFLYFALNTVRAGAIDGSMNRVVATNVDGNGERRDVQRRRTAADSMMMTFPLQADEDDAPDALAALTIKQREVLDLLIQHKTSKEISRLLGISPHTVDQRIMLARAKLNVATRGEVALQYRRLLEERSKGAGSFAEDTDFSTEDIWEKPIYRSSHVDPSRLTAQPAGQEDDVPVQTAIDRFREAPRQMGAAAAIGAEPAIPEYHRVLPEMFDGPNGTMVRLGAIAAITVFLILIILGGLAIFSQLSQIIGH